MAPMRLESSTIVRNEALVNHDPSSEMSRKKEQVSSVFDRVAATYGQSGPPFFSHFADRLVELAQVPRDVRVLDIATGRGAVLFPAAARVGPGGSVTGIDISEAMVRETTREARRRGIENVEIRRMDAEELRFPDACFDHALCGLGLFFFPRAGRALSEVLRVLKPGGGFAASTWGKDEGPWERLYDVFKTYLPSASEASRPKTPAPDFETPEGIEALLRAAGFADTRVVHESADFVYATKEDWWATQWTHGARGTIERIESASGPEGLARFQAEIFDHLDAMKRPDGIHHVMHVLVTLAAKPEC